MKLSSCDRRSNDWSVKRGKHETHTDCNIDDAIDFSVFADK